MSNDQILFLIPYVFDILSELCGFFYSSYLISKLPQFMIFYDICRHT